MSTRIIKFKYGSDIRKISIGGDCDTYVKLKHLVEFIFRDRSFDTGLRYKYVDSDGDLITIRNDEDWRMALLYEKNLKIYVYPDTCKTDIDPCVAVKNAMLLSQHEAINVAEQLAVMRTLLLRIIERIAGEKGYDNGSLIDKGFKYGINKSTGSHFQ
ncbi:unnamed protein product [Dicrocoelium dendriticum]|nr:unnamed protein product [Dicrocoelium dendriticum]